MKIDITKILKTAASIDPEEFTRDRSITGVDDDGNVIREGQNGFLDADGYLACLPKAMMNPANARLFPDNIEDKCIVCDCTVMRRPHILGPKMRVICIPCGMKGVPDEEH